MASKKINLKNEKYKKVLSLNLKNKYINLSIKLKNEKYFKARNNFEFT